MKLIKKTFYLLLILALLGITSLAVAQVSTNADLSWHVQSGGGAMRDSSTTLLVDAIGQTAVNRSQSTNAVVHAGFLAGLTTIIPFSYTNITFLPLLQR